MKTTKTTLFFVCLIALSLAAQRLVFAGGGGQQGGA
jgi:hypothetical protein